MSEDPDKPSRSLSSAGPKYTFVELFPDEFCRSAMSELNAWTAVTDVAAAARCMAGKPEQSDLFDRRLILPFPDDDKFEAVVIKSIGWLIDAYRPPLPKIALAALSEPLITPYRAAEIGALRFRPDGMIGPPGAITKHAPALSDSLDQRFFLIEDEPHVIEILQGPLRCLMSLIHKCMHDTEAVAAAVDATDGNSNGKAKIYHKPYADSTLPAIIEALCFFVYGLDFGPIFANDGEAILESGYRSLNLVASPPIAPKFLAEVGELNRQMLDDLR